MSQYSKHPYWDELYPSVFHESGTEFLLQYSKSYDLNQCTDEHGNTLLHHVVQLGRYHDVFNMCNLFIDPNLKNGAGQTVLELAQDTELDSLQTLHEDYLCINFAKASSEPNGLDALFAAIYRGDATLGDTSGVEDDGNEKNEGGWTALQCAAMYDRSQLIRELHQRFPNLDVDHGNYPALHLAAKHGHSNSIIALCECFPAIKEDNALHLVCEYDRSACIPTLRECFPHLTGNELYYGGYSSALIEAVKSNHPECIRALHACFPDLDPNLQNEYGSTALIAGILDIDSISVLFECFPDIDLNKQDEYGKTALIRFVLYGQQSDVAIMLSTYLLHCDVNMRDCDGKTALMLVVQNHDQERLSALHKYFPDVDPNMQDNDGNTALMIALDEHDGVSIISQLRKLFPTIDPNVQNNNQNTALMLLLQSWYCSVDYILPFFDSFPNVDTNIENAQGETALTIAIKEGNASIVTLLLDCVPDIYLQQQQQQHNADSTGKTALVVAIQENQIGTLSVLLNHIIDVFKD